MYIVIHVSHNYTVTDNTVNALYFSQMLHNLKVLQLRRLNMVRINLSGCFNLERLIIEECQELVRIDRSIGELKQLAHLNIERCSKLRDLPDEINLLVNLKHLCLRNCSKLRELPGFTGELNSLIKLDLSFTSMKRLPYPLANRMTSNVKKRKDCRRVEFPSASGLVTKLEVIRARCGSMVGKVSSEIGNLSFLRILDLSDSQIRRVPETIGALPHLEELILKNCNQLQVLPSLPTSLTHLLVSSRSLQSIPDLSNLTSLVNLLLSDGNVSRSSPPSILTETCNLEWIGELSKLETLELCLPTITLSPTSLGSLSRLRKLDISGHQCSKFLMQPPKSAMQGYTSSRTTFPGLSSLRNLKILKLCRSLEKEIQLGGLEQLRHLTVRDFRVLERIIFSLPCPKNLKELELEDCPELREIEGLGALETLESLKVNSCSSIRTLGDLSKLQKLVELRINRCNELLGFEGLDESGCLSLFKVNSCRSLGFWTNAWDTKIPDECQVQIQRCPKLGITLEGGMFYKDYRDKILRRIKSDSDACSSKSKGKVHFHFIFLHLHEISLIQGSIYKVTFGGR